MKQFIKILILSVSLIFISGLHVYAEDTVTLPVTGVYNQTSARTLLSFVNDLRTSKEIPELEYDQELEHAAMIRAMEISIFFASKRTDESDWFTVLNNSSSACQLRAYGQRNAESAFIAYKNNENNMACLVNPVYSYMGAAHVIRGDVDFWVVIMRKEKGIETIKDPVDGSVTKDISILASRLISYVSPSPIDMSYGDSFDASEIKEYCSYQGASSYNKQWSYDISDTLEVTDDEIIESDGKILTFKSAGYTSIKVSLLSSGNQVTIPVNISKKAISEENITLSSREFTYNGSYIKPAVNIRVNGQDLIEGTDYSLCYKNNKNVSSKGGYVTITGMGNYDSETNVYFMISGADISGYTLSLDQEKYKYTGTAISPSYVIKNGKTTLRKDYDYYEKLTDNTSLGTATLTVYGMGNYKGRLSAQFSIYDEAPEPKESEIISSSEKKVKMTKLQAGSSRLTVTWERKSGVTGYEVQYSTNRKFKTSKTTTKSYANTKKKAVIKKLRRGKTYYVRVRSYRKSGNNKICSIWSKPKKVKVK